MGNPESIETKIRFASMRQIDAAIEHLHRGDFECAITLAGAGEGMLPETDNPHFRKRAMALEAMLPKSDEGENTANAYINWLKPGTLKRNGPRVENATISELEVIVTIWRAITKFNAVYVVVEADRTPQMIEFANWARAHLHNAGNPN